jgi:hypothetical protein
MLEINAVLLETHAISEWSGYGPEKRKSMPIKGSTSPPSYVQYGSGSQPSCHPVDTGKTFFLQNRSGQSADDRFCIPERTKNVKWLLCRIPLIQPIFLSQNSAKFLR